MYTVIRFAHSASSEALQEFALELCQSTQGIFTGMDRVPNRFSCSIAKSGNWAAHRAEIVTFLEKNEGVIRAARAKDIGVSLDVAIEPEDYAHRLFADVEIDLMLGKLLVESAVSLFVTVYPSGTRELETTSDVPESTG